LIFFKKDKFEKKINLAVFPGLQGGPHQHTISGIAVALKMAKSESFKQYQQQVLDNCKALAKTLSNLGFDLVSGGSDNHLVLIDLRKRHIITGNQVEKVCEQVGLVLNKNTVPGDRSAVNPSGLRVGSPAMTSRGAGTKDFEQIAKFIAEAVEITQNVVTKNPLLKNIHQFEAFIKQGEPDIARLKLRVESFASSFDVVGSKVL
jgi:glycine hydroxymethyltransferase